ncbi:MAG: DNA-processing protein DprA [Acidimicrobiia bacterium]|nr:DNA-processing protein DprA [Acidimicrobiia bacterium]
MADPGILQLAHAGLAPRTVDRIIERFGGIVPAVRAIAAGAADVSEWARSQVLVPAEERRAALADMDVTFTAFDDRDFPDRLDRFAGSPRWLFSRGRFADGPSIAIVGTRTCTAYGLELAEVYGRAAARAEWNVVSGLAKGIDGAAHEGALSVGGTCVAVLGSGVDVIYPRRHRALYRSIVERGGFVASEFPPGTRPDAWRFPTRNRIIAGLSDVVVVVEAGERGGALITAGIALEYGIPVFAAPGDVDRPASAGTNRLIRDGAFPVFDGDDLAEVLTLIRPTVAQ